MIAVIPVTCLSSRKSLRTFAHWLTTARACPSGSSCCHFAGIAAWKSGEVPVYDRKSRHLVFGESGDEKEIRVDSEHALLMKGKLSGHQFEPLFEASIALWPTDATRPKDLGRGSQGRSGV